MALSKTSKWVGGAAVVVAIAAGVGYQQGWFSGQKADKAAAAQKELPLVSVARSQAVDLPIKFSAQGHLVPQNLVDIRPQITGIVRTVNFHEGDDIKQGQLLFTIDAADVTALLNRVQAQAAQIQAQLDEANRDYNRSKELVKSEFISSSAVDTNLSKVHSLQAQLKASHAEIESARVQAGYTRITAPISAKAGATAVHPGSLARAGDTTPLVTLIQFDPIGVEFTLPEQNLSALLAAHAAGQTSVSVETSDGEQIKGKLIFINNTVNTTTGTISLKAIVPNKTQRLWPGGFVRVILNAGVNKGAIVLPPQAVLEGPKGHFVYLIADDGKVTAKPVTLLRIQDQNAVLEGLENGERVVVEGNQNLRSGMKASVVDAGNSAGPPASPPVVSSSPASTPSDTAARTPPADGSASATTPASGGGK